MKPISTSVFALIAVFLFFGCSDSNTSNSSVCERNAQIVSETVFNNITTANYNIVNVALNEDCLDITIASSGCSGETWQMNLYSTSEFSETAIPQKDLKLGLFNNEACLAIVQKTVSFSLIPYQIDGQNEITLFIQGWATPITYTY